MMTGQQKEQTMQRMTLEQLGAASNASGVACVRLKGLFCIAVLPHPALSGCRHRLF
jgi:hypothetical protein